MLKIQDNLAEKDAKRTMNWSPRPVTTSEQLREFEMNVASYLATVTEDSATLHRALPHVHRLVKTEIRFDNPSDFFFLDNETIRTKATRGIVETPREIARFMVEFAFERWIEGKENKPRDGCPAHWLDPSAGAGIFPIEILRFYRTIGKTDLIDLPRLTISELSEVGLAVTFVNVSLELISMGVSLRHYFSSGKVKLLLGDTLARFPESPDIFGERHSFDIVIGNPPYVRATRLDSSYKYQLQKGFPGLFSGSADLYTYFLGSGISHLGEDGLLVFISPATFTRAKSAAALRGWLLRKSHLDAFIDLDEVNVFEDASLHAAIYAFRRGAKSVASTKYLHITSPAELAALTAPTVALETAVLDCPAGAGWAFHQSAEQHVAHSKLFSHCVKMSETGIKVFSGIRTGLTAAFFLNAEQYSLFSREAREKWIKPLVLASDLIRWSGAKSMNYMITIPSYSKNVHEEILEHLRQYKDALEKRLETRNDNPWYALRACSYYDEMERRKIAFPDLSAQQRFSLVEKDIYIPDGAYFINTDDLLLLAILNSEVARKYFIHRCSSIGNLNSKGRFRFKKEFVKDFPLPKNFLCATPLHERIRQLVSLIMAEGETDERTKELNEMVFAMYQEI